VIEFLLAKPTIDSLLPNVSGSGNTNSASARSRIMAANASANPGGPGTSTNCKSTPNMGAAARSSFNATSAGGMAEFQRTATRAVLGNASLSNARRLVASSGASEVTPVIFAPGRARLATIRGCRLPERSGRTSFR
jgi:hypothetical protein